MQAVGAPSASPPPTGAPSPPRAAAPPPPHGATVARRYDAVVKSQEDKRLYRGLELSNKMKVLLVSDPATDKSAAALDVNVGYLSDPDHIPGLAHFCEHMLFLGTEKYPKENEYNKFLSEHGGSSNASTSSDHTTYYFDVLPEHLPAALHIFAQFFIAPLFTAEATERELNAVNSEHEKNRSSDTWRLDQLNRSTASPDHPYSKFGTGNRETLEVIPRAAGVDVRAELLAFHAHWYSADVMALVVLGKESLDELESLVAPLFAEVACRGVTAPSWPQHPYPPALRRKRAYVEPVKDLRSLSLTMPVPDTREHYRSAPGHYLSHLVGHEGPGSLLSALRKRGWCNSLVGGTRNGGRGFSFFSVQVDLTEEGVNHVDSIIKLVFQYLAMLRQAGPQRWVWEEQRELMAMEFRFKDTQEPRHLVHGHVHSLQSYPVEEVLSYHYLISEWRPDLITELLELLTPDNVRVGIIAKCFKDKCTETEKWYGTRYLQQDIAEETLAEWRAAAPCDELHLPPPNEFIPARLELEPREDCTQHHTPAIVRDSPKLRLWYKQDNEFLLPKAIISFDFHSPLAYSEPLACNLLSVWGLLLRDSLVEYSYAAELAGLRYNLVNSKHGIQVSIEGHDDKQHVLLERVVQRMCEFRADPARFLVMKEGHERALRNFEAEQPYQHAVYQQALTLTDHAWTRRQLEESAPGMTVELMNEYAANFMKRVHCESLMVGNLTRERALAMADIVESKLPKDGVPLLTQQLLQNREVEMEPGSHYLREVENSVHRSSCASLYYACGRQATRDNVLLELMLHIFSEPCFNQLRTEEQLGYIVFSGMRRSHGVQGMRVIVQSDRSPTYVEDRVEAFIASMEEYVTRMPEEEVARHRAALAAQRLERPKRLSTRVGHMFSEIGSQQYNFERARVEVEQLETVTREELLAFYRRFVWHGSAERRKLSVHVVSTMERAADAAAAPAATLAPPPRSVEPVRVADLVEFKTGRALYPTAQPYVNIPRKGAHCKL